MQNHQSSYTRQSWIIALTLALTLLWMLPTGKGPSNTCCSALEAAAPAAEAMSEEAVTAEPFTFSATEQDFTSASDLSEVTWADADIGGLKALLAGSIKAEDDNVFVVLNDEAESEELKQEKS